VPIEHGIDDRHQGGDLLWMQFEVILDPELEVAASLWLVLRIGLVWAAHQVSSRSYKGRA
jgi:hypothetical protein